MLQESVETSKRAAHAAQASSSADLEDMGAQVQDLQRQRADDAHAASTRSVWPLHAVVTLGDRKARVQGVVVITAARAAMLSEVHHTMSVGLLRLDQPHCTHHI